MRSRKIVSILCFVIIVFVASSCSVTTFDTDYVEKFSKYFDYSLGEYRIYTEDDSVVTKSFGFHFDGEMATLQNRL